VIPTLKPGDLIAGLGVSSVAIGFAFKDILQNWLAGLLILLRNPFCGSIPHCLRYHPNDRNINLAEPGSMAIRWAM